MLLRISLLTAFATCIIAAFLFAPPRVLSQSSQPSYGYAWSDTIGWIELNCANSGVCASNPFGLSADSNGAVSGYAWSDNIGWVSANAADLTGCPSAPCSSTLSPVALSGWLRALSGNTSQSGGWDGFIRLSGSNYSVTLTGPTFSGFAWGDNNVGWVDFSLASTVLQCVPAFSCLGNSVHNSCTNQDVPCPSDYTCVGGQCIASAAPAVPTASLTVSPSLITFGATTQVLWSSSNVAFCSVSENNPNISDGWTTSSGSQTSSPIWQQTTYTLMCTGTDGSTLIKTASVNILPFFQEK